MRVRRAVGRIGGGGGGRLRRGGGRRRRCGAGAAGRGVGAGLAGVFFVTGLICVRGLVTTLCRRGAERVGAGVEAGLLPSSSSSGVEVAVGSAAAALLTGTLAVVRFGFLAGLALAFGRAVAVAVRGGDRGVVAGDRLGGAAARGWRRAASSW